MHPFFLKTSPNYSPFLGSLTVVSFVPPLLLPCHQNFLEVMDSIVWEDKRKEFSLSVGLFFGSQSTAIPVSILIFISGRGTEKAKNKPLPMRMGRRSTEVDLCDPWSSVGRDVKVKNPVAPSRGGAKVNPLDCLWRCGNQVRLTPHLGRYQLSTRAFPFPAVPVSEGPPRYNCLKTICS